MLARFQKLAFLLLRRLLKQIAGLGKVLSGKRSQAKFVDVLLLLHLRDPVVYFRLDLLHPKAVLHGPILQVAAQIRDGLLAPLLANLFRGFLGCALQQHREMFVGKEFRRAFGEESKGHDLFP